MKTFTPSMYLCGPITGCTYEDSRYSWREKVIDEIDERITCWSPMRSKSEETFDDQNLKSMSPLGSDHDVLSTPRGLTERDRFDTMRSDIIFCNLLGATRISIGSVIELGWADAMRIPVILVMEKEGNPHHHAMVYQTISWQVHSLEHGIKVAESVLLPGI